MAMQTIFLSICFLMMGLMGGFVSGMTFSLDTLDRERRKIRKGEEK